MLSGRLGQEPPPHEASGLLDADAEGPGLRPHVDAGGLAWEAHPAGQTLDERLVLVGRGAAEAMIDVGRDEPDRQFLLRQCRKDPQEGHRVGAAAGAHDDRLARLAWGEARQEVVPRDRLADEVGEPGFRVGRHRRAL
jgi:hypothetical protein